MRLPALSTRELRNFVLLAGSPSLKDAAEACALSQPALSLQLKQLESKLGAQLVVRANAHKRIELTPAGTELLHAARHALQVLQDAVDRINPAPPGERPSLRVACLPSLLRDLVSPVLAELVKSHPGAQISVFDSDSAACCTMLSAGKCEVAVCSRPVNGPDIASQCLFSENFCAVLNGQDARARRSHLTLDDFVGCTVVNLSDNVAVRSSLLARAIPAIQVNTITALEGLLAQGVGAAILAHSTAELVRHPSLVKIPLADAEITRQIFQSWRQRPANPLAADFVARLRAKAAPGY